MGVKNFKHWLISLPKCIELNFEFGSRWFLGKTSDYVHLISLFIKNSKEQYNKNSFRNIKFDM